MCDFMNDCNGNGSCNSYGKCVCDAGYFGADCTSVVGDLSSSAGSETVSGNRWFYYLVPEDSGDVSISIASDRPVSVYVRKGTTDLPDPVTFDALVKDETQITFTSQVMNFAEGVIIAVHCEGDADDQTTFTVDMSQMESVLVQTI